MLKFCHQFLRDERGVFIVVGVWLAPLLVAVTGFAIDYSRAETARRAMQHAVDSAALAIAQAQIVEKETPEAEARPFVEANIEQFDGVTINDIRVRQIEYGHALVEVDARIKNLFLGLAGYETYPIQVKAEVRFSDPPDVDFIVAMDRSPSMLIGSTITDMSLIGAINKEIGEGNGSCGFACHYPGRDSYTLSRGEGIDTRLDAAKAAVERSFALARERSTEDTGLIYAHVYTFTTELEDVTSGLVNTVLTSGRIQAIAPSPDWTGNRYARTDYNESLAEAVNRVRRLRDMNPKRMAFFLLITDGVADYVDGGRKIEPIDPALCAAIKNTGTTVSVVYTTYFPIYTNRFYNRKVRPFENDIGPKLSACATPGWFFEAQYAEDLDAALDTILGMASPRPQLVQ